MSSTEHTHLAWTCIFKSSSRFEAEAVRGNLENANIPAVVVNKQDSSYLAFGYVEVHVPSEQVEAARVVIDNPFYEN
jgi:hypothetical protein